MDRKKQTIIMIVLLVVLGGVLLFFFIRDDKKSVIERKTGYELPSYCTIEKYVAYGSIFNRTGFEAKIRIDNNTNMNATIMQMYEKLGEDHHEITLQEFNVEKYSLFADQKLVPEPTTVSWVIVGKAGKGSLVVFMCIENQTECYMYMYYAE